MQNTSINREITEGPRRSKQPNPNTKNERNGKRWYPKLANESTAYTRHENSWQNWHQNYAYNHLRHLKEIFVTSKMKQPDTDTHQSAIIAM